LLEKFLLDSGLKNRKNGPIIMVGGMQATMTPMVFAEMADYVFIGDADDHLGLILDQIEQGERPTCEFLYSKGMSSVPAPSECKPSAFALNKGGARETIRIEIARGCKHKCSFCALSGLKSYREVPFCDLETVIRATKGKKSLVLFAPERMCHSEWEKITALIKELGVHDLGQDVRLERLPQLESQTAIVGIEGLSYKLRKSIKKNFTDKFILSQIGEWVGKQRGICTLGMYFIADLPGEVPEDWTECFSLFEAIEKENWSRKINIRMALNPLSPKPFTTFYGQTIHPFRDYAGKWEDFQRRGGGGQWGFRIKESIVWPESDRVLDAIIEKGGALAYSVVKKIPYKYLSSRPKRSESIAFGKWSLNLANKEGLSDELLGIDREGETK
jgi:hypothetical protein